MSPKRLADAVGVFRRAVEDGRVTGVQLLVARNDKVVDDEALGWRDLEKRLPMERNTLVRMASNTKSVVATGILKLVDDERLAQSDPVSEHLPGYPRTSMKVEGAVFCVGARSHRVPSNNEFERTALSLREAMNETGVLAVSATPSPRRRSIQRRQLAITNTSHRRIE